MSRHWSSSLSRLGACGDAIAFAKQHDSLESAWGLCERGDWMLWLLAKTTKREDVALAACACARLALRFVPAGEDRPLNAIETAERWATGGATIEEVRNAANAAAAAAAYAAAYAAYADAAYAAAYAAYAAAAYAAAAANAAYAANAAAYAAYAADAARSTLKECAGIVRERFPNPPQH